MKHCLTCGSLMPDDSPTCIRCGSDQSRATSTEPRAAKDWSWIFYLFVGVVCLLIFTSNSEDAGTPNSFGRGALFGALFGTSLWRVVWALRSSRKSPPADGAKKKSSGCLTALASGCLTALAVYFVVMIGFAAVAISISPPLKGMKAAAGPVVIALDKYRGDHGSYPASLDALVPAYFSKLPGCQPGDPGSRLHYLPEKDSGEYVLICPSFMFQTHQYNSKTKKWRTGER